MQLKVVGSGSSGNCYLLENETECLILDAGIPYGRVKVALDFNVSKIVGLLVTHEHQDHARYMKAIADAGITTFAPFIGKKIPEKMTFGNFQVMAFPLVHSVPCYGFLIYHPEMGKLIYATDTAYIKYRFKGLNHMLIEANYDEPLIHVDAPNSEHVLTGHMSLDTACAFIMINRSDALQNVVLAHLSGDNSKDEYFIDKASKVANTDVYTARAGVVVDVTKGDKHING